MDEFTLAVKSLKDDLDKNDPYFIWLRQFQIKLDKWSSNDPFKKYMFSNYNFLLHLYINHFYNVKNNITPIHNSSNKIYKLLSKDIHNKVSMSVRNFKYIDKINEIKKTYITDDEKLLYKFYFDETFRNYKGYFQMDVIKNYYLELYEIYNFDYFNPAVSYKSVRKIN